ncbi:MAG: GntG family PLP-dependent aldolase [Bacteroidota bacterium]
MKNTTIIDLRSDTVTKPTPAMREAMMGAEVGDDVLEHDPSVKKLEDKAAEMFGMEAALFCPSGTMTNQIGLRIQTQPQDQIICDQLSHIYWYEGGGPAYNSLVSLRLIQGDRGRISAPQIEENINADDPHLPVTRLVSLENTANRAGGSCYNLNEIKAIREICDKHGLALHLDGARLFNALIKTGDTPKDYGKLFDTISICLSKGLGAPVGSLLLSSTAALHKKALRVRKVLGGAMRQSGFLAAAGLYALENNIDRLQDDHRRAQTVAGWLEKSDFVAGILPVETNIVVFRLKEADKVSNCLEALKEVGVLATPFGKGMIRFTLHLDISEEMVEQLEKRLKRVNF